MIKGSTKVGEVFLCGTTTNGYLEVQSQFLGKAITALGGGCSKLFVIEEGDGYQGILNPLHPFDQDDKFFQGQDEKAGIQQQEEQDQQLGLTPFDQQQNFYQLQKPLTNVVDQRIEERESLRHSTHRSQRSERANNVATGNPMQQTATERFGNTDYNSEHQERPPFQQQSATQGGNRDDAEDIQEAYSDLAHQMENQDHISNDDEPSKMFTFDDNQNNVQMQQQQQEDKQSQRSAGNKEQQQFKQSFAGAPSRTQQHDNMGHLMMVQSGRNHSIHLTRDGDVFSYGSGIQCAVGHGGAKAAYTPTVLKPLRDKRIVQIACGEHHSIVLTDRADVYAWGRGFEGQLGLSKSISIASTPQYLKSFYGKPVNYIACGSFFSLAITKDGSLYGWGESRFGQLGTKDQKCAQLPQRIVFPSEGSQGENLIQCAAGYGHVAALTESHCLYTWGFGVYGQLGQTNNDTLYTPSRVYYANGYYNIPEIVKVKCSKYATFILDSQGKPYAAGKGYMGFGGESKHPFFYPIERNTDNRIFTDIFSNENSVIFYAPIRVYQIEPKSGPASGGTIIKIVGTGFVNSEKLRVRFSYGDLSQEVTCQYDAQEKSLMCKTPKFEEFEGQQHPSLKLPCSCIISVTMDGIHYSECEEQFKIYSNDIYLTSINPKCGGVTGGTSLTLLINIDDQTAQTLYNLKIGFQPKKNITREIQKKAMEQNTKSYQSLNESNKSSVVGSKQNTSALQNYNEQQQQDNTNEAADEQANNWACAYGYYENGTIQSTVPALEHFDQESLQFNVDVALNGQQFTGRPLQFRYYDIQIERIEPAIGPSEGGTVINILGVGLYDSSIKRVKFETYGYERVVTAQWDRKLKCLQCIVPPLTWLFGGAELPEDELDKIKQTPIRVLLTFNNQEWIQAKDFKYHDHKVERIAYAQQFGQEIADLNEREKHWRSEEALDTYPSEMPAEEVKKKEDEKNKKALEDSDESSTVPKRKGVKMFVFGSNYVKSDNLKVKFTHAASGVSKETQGIFKNQKKIGCEVPDMGGEVPVGHHHLTVEVSLNGQQFSSNGVMFLYNSVDPNMSEEELKKLDEAEEKNAKKPAAKKK